MNELRVLAGGGIVHADGVAIESLEGGLSEDPHYIGLDSGSSDAGPAYLGSGSKNLQGSRESAKSVYEPYIERAPDKGIPILIGSAATAGTNYQVDWTKDIIKEIAKEKDKEITIATVHTEQSDEVLKEKVKEGKTIPLNESEALTEETIEKTDHAVGVTGPEAYIEALEQGADVVIAGRASDVSIFKSLALKEGFPEGLATHMAKSIECSGMIAKPKTTGECMLGIITDDYFRVKTTRDEKYTDPLTVASHMVYENANPYRLREPRGILDTHDCNYESVDDRTVEVRGSKFERKDYTIKIEGAREVGYRSLSICGIRDPSAVKHVDTLIEKSQNAVAEKASDLGLDEDDYVLTFDMYGRDGVMRKNEPVDEPAHELGVLIKAIAPTEDTADALIGRARVEILHAGYPERKATAANVAFPISPPDVRAGKAYEWTMNHATEVDEPNELFDITLETVGQKVPGGAD